MKFKDIFPILFLFVDDARNRFESKKGHSYHPLPVSKVFSLLQISFCEVCIVKLHELTHELTMSLSTCEIKLQKF